MENKDIKAVVLAAGKGKRLGSEQFKLPKVMREACGRPLLSYVLRSIDFIPPQDTVLVVGYMMEKIIEAYGPKYVYAEQREQLGTGHAAICAMKELPDFKGTVLICYGDMPLVRRSSYRALLHEHTAKGNACTLLAGLAEDPTGYGRVVVDGDGKFMRIVEERDCTPKEKGIKLINSGIYAFDSQALLSVLPRLANLNAQGEYYITDAPALIKEDGLPVSVLKSLLPDEAVGVNTLEQLAFIEKLIQADGLAF